METNRLVIPHGPGWRSVLIVFAVGAGLVAIFWTLAGHDGWPAYALMLCFLLLVSVFGETEFDPLNRLIVRRWSLLNLIPLWQKQRLISDFSSVSVTPRDDPDRNRTWFVRLTTKSGRHLNIKWFGYSAQLPTEACNLQSRLSEVTGLPIRNELR